MVCFKDRYTRNKFLLHKLKLRNRDCSYVAYKVELDNWLEIKIFLIDS